MHRKKRARPLKKKPKHATSSKKLKKNLKSHKNATFKRRPAKVLSPSQGPAPKMGTQAFKALQKLWYAKLKATGFQDLETSGPDSDGPLSTRGAQPQANFETASMQFRDLYYRRLTNFVTHNPNWAGTKLANLVALLYIDGVSYRKMVPIIKARLKVSTSIWSVHKIVKRLEARSSVWNRVHPEGIDFQADFETPA